MAQLMTTRSFAAGLLLAAAGFGAGACSSPPKKQPLSMQDMIVADPLPLAKGAKWTYSVSVKRYDTDANTIATKTINWVTEVLDAKEQDGVTAYRVKGWPTDLTEYDGTGAIPVATETTILRKDNAFLFASSSNKGEPDLHGATGWFQWPVIDGQKICPSAEMVYCWQVSAVEGGYKLSFYTGPDEQSFELEPGTGVSRFRYAHHGTTNEVDCKLVSYTKGSRR
jgi:hypothetical protein